jgi:sulfite reductase (NADPH) flavoprotein alpha-component
MTQAATYIVIFLATLLFLHLFWIAYLKLHPSQRKQKPTDQIAQCEYLIVYASQSGNATNLAQQTAAKLQQNQISVELIDIQNLNQTHLLQASQVLWFVSTYGEGDAPDSARAFVQKMLNQSIDLSHLKFAILALGDRGYQNFCQFGKNLNQWLVHQQAEPLFEMICVDELNANDLTRWSLQLNELTQVNMGQISQQKADWQALHLVERELLNAGSQGNPLFRVRLEAKPEVVWQSGDIVEIQCANGVQRIDDFMMQYSAESQSINKSDLLYKNLVELPERAESETFQAWISRFESLDYREYSVASTPEQGFIELVIRQSIDQGELGLGSGWMTVHSHLGEQILVRIRSNPNFHLLQENQAAIFIGNGSGIAGLLAHLHARHQLAYTDNWLIFGEREKQYDSLYPELLQTWQKSGFLTDLDLVFSRDGNQHKYVKDCLLSKAEQLKTWVDKGAAIYVCGSLKTMGVDVDHSLNRILGEEKVIELLQQKRYLRDVY